MTGHVCCRSLFLAPREKPRNRGPVRDGLHSAGDWWLSCCFAENHWALWVCFLCPSVYLCPFLSVFVSAGPGPVCWSRPGPTVAPLGFCVSRSVFRCAVCWDLASRWGYGVVTPSPSVSSDSREVLSLCFTHMVKVSIHSLRSVLWVWSFSSVVLYKMHNSFKKALQKQNRKETVLMLQTSLIMQWNYSDQFSPNFVLSWLCQCS